MHQYTARSFVLLIIVTAYAYGASDKPIRFSGDIAQVIGNCLHYEQMPWNSNFAGHQLEGPFISEYKGTKRTVDPSEISNLTFIEIQKFGSFGSNGDISKATVNVHFRDGNDVNTTLSDWFYNGFTVQYIDELSGTPNVTKISAFEKGRLVVRTVTFAENVGNMKYNPKTKAYYPPQFLYDPYMEASLFGNHLNEPRCSLTIRSRESGIGVASLTLKN